MNCLPGCLTCFRAPAFSPLEAQNLTPKRTLTIEHAQDIQSLKLMVADWSAVANSKKEQTTGEYENKFKELAAELIDIITYLEYFDPENQNNRIFICKDEALEEVQAIGIIRIMPKTNSIYLSFLATHPKNVRAPINLTDNTRVEGAGSAIMNHVIAFCRESKIQKLIIFADGSLQPFYGKFGFQPDPSYSPSMDPAPKLFKNIEM